MTEKNTFADLEKSAANSEETKVQKPHKAGGEIDLTNFSDTAVGDKKKYVRPDLNQHEQVVDKYQVFEPDPSKDELKDSQSGTSKYWSVTQIITYDSENEDGVQNREYVSGAIAFEQRDGSASDISFWYEGCEHQSGMVWEAVALALGKEPKELSPREFIVFLNSKPKVAIEGMQYKNYGAVAGSPKFVTKNMPKAFKKA